MARKEVFTPIWDFGGDDDAKKRKKDERRGAWPEADMRGESRVKPEEDKNAKNEGPAYRGGIFGEEWNAHGMNGKKEKRVIAAVIVAAIVIAVFIFILNVRMRRTLI